MREAFASELSTFLDGVRDGPVAAQSRAMVQQHLRSLVEPIQASLTELGFGENCIALEARECWTKFDAAKKSLEILEAQAPGKLAVLLLAPRLSNTEQ